MKKQPEPTLTKAGSRLVLLGVFARPSLVNIRVVPEKIYKEMIKALKKSGDYDQIFINKKLPKP